MEPWFRNRWFAGLIYALLGLLVLYMLLQIKPLLRGVFQFLEAVLMPFLIALIISYVLNPVVSLLGQRKVPRTIAVLLIYSVFVTSLVVIFMNLTPMFMEQVQELNEHMPELTLRAQSIVDGYNHNDMLPTSIRDGINKSLGKLETSVSEIVSDYLSSIGTTIGTLFIIFIVPFVSFYMLKDFQMLEKTALAVVPKSQRQRIVRLLLDIDTALGHYIRGQLLVCLIVGALAYFGYLIIGMPYPLLLASIVAVFNIIPYLGPFFGAAPALLMASTISMKMVLFVALVNFAVQVAEGNIISPQVVGKSLHLHPLVIIFALLVGGQIGGIFGLILAVPMFAVLKVIVEHIVLHYIRHRTPRF
ncbi:AI-2E family transporter [Paenibacillus chartarius]|uniref:AI-2E family transporter n=1 Tax=Paenibacillus chartarius TaxID=747481 RepID=A0ABV6DIQ6_9BACL